MISIIIPFYNEKDSLPILFNRLIEWAQKLKKEYEIIFVDDGSTDNFQFSFFNFQKNIRLIKHKKRLGKGAALLSGFNASKGEVIVFMDADWQNDPADLPKFLMKIEEGFQLVNGWRKKRKDSFLKTFPSSVYNSFLLRLILQSKFHDVNCGFKAVKREVLEAIPLYADNYRLLPILAEREGFKTTEVTIAHHPRKYGQSKFGVWRLFFGLVDVLTYYFLLKYFEKPLHFFGMIGGSILGAGVLILLYLGIERLFFHHLLYRRPVLFLGMLLVIVGVQVIVTGFIGELIVYLNKKKK